MHSPLLAPTLRQGWLIEEHGMATEPVTLILFVVLACFGSSALSIYAL
jgi:hypothetical protein